MCFILIRWKATRAGNFLDKILDQTRQVQGLNSNFIQFISPFTACIRQPWVQLLLFGTGIYQLLFAYSAIITFETFGTESYKAYRLNYEPDVPGAYSLNLLRRGCVIASQSVSSQHPNSTYMSFQQPTEIDGFEIIPSRDAGLPSAASFLLLGSDDLSAWAIAGSSNFRRVSKGVRFLSGPPQPVSGTRFDFRAPWPLFTYSVTAPLLFGLGCLATALCGTCAWLWRVDTQAAGRAVFVGFCALLGLHALAVAAGFAALGAPRDAFLPLNDCAVFLLLAAVLARREMLFFDALRALAWYGLACRVAADWGLHADPAYLLADPPVQPIAFAVVGALFVT